MTIFKLKVFTNEAQSKTSDFVYWKQKSRNRKRSLLEIDVKHEEHLFFTFLTIEELTNFNLQ